MHRLSKFPPPPIWVRTTPTPPPLHRTINTTSGGSTRPSFLESFTSRPQARPAEPGTPFQQGARSQKTSHRQIQERLHKILRSPVLERCKADTLHTFAHIGLSAHQSREMWAFVVHVLGQDRSLKDIEQQIFTKFSTTFVPGEGGRFISLTQSINEKLAGRARLIHEQIAPFLIGVHGHVLDFGCGDGKVAQLIQEQHPHLLVCGVDVADYKDPSVSVPIGIFSGHRVPVASSKVDCIVATNVLHHEANNQGCLDEMVRVLTPDGKLIIIETVPVGDTLEAIELDRDRTFWNDLIYNRWLHDGDIPVPGTYETPQGWAERFQASGFQAKHTQNLGVDQATIQDTHELQVYVPGPALRMLKLVEQALSNERGGLKREQEAINEWLRVYPAFKTPIERYARVLCDIRNELPSGEERERRVHTVRVHTLRQLRAGNGITANETQEATHKLSALLQKARAEAVRV